jgi:hypothetical protein
MCGSAISTKDLLGNQSVGNIKPPCVRRRLQSVKPRLTWNMGGDGELDAIQLSWETAIIPNRTWACLESPVNTIET